MINLQPLPICTYVIFLKIYIYNENGTLFTCLKVPKEQKFSKITRDLIFHLPCDVESRLGIGGIEETKVRRLKRHSFLLYCWKKHIKKGFVNHQKHKTNQLCFYRYIMKWITPGNLWADTKKHEDRLSLRVLFQLLLFPTMAKVELAEVQKLITLKIFNWIF
ncbi:hypothetical protein Hdeb2414_s0008g00292191 [Helianthus debilis subsp. tardiflorus]